MSFIKRWWTFLRERHDPFGITLMVACFFSAIAFVAYQPAVHVAPCFKRLGAGFALVWLIFLHMRLFDEVKDYEYDKQFNPLRPLPRGLISLNEFMAMTMACLALEFVIAGLMAWPVLPAYMMVLCFTLLMRMEFFVGDWMRPKLELYAVTHTFSAAMISLLIHVIVCFTYINVADKAALVFALGNWFVFNVFEFGRKTFAPEEERDGVESYSGRLKPLGAVILLLANVALAYVCFYYAASVKFASANLCGILLPAGLVSLLAAAAGALYAIKPKLAFAKLYRGTVTFYLLAYSLAVSLSVYFSVYR